jgi:hypothetical protein
MRLVQLAHPAQGRRVALVDEPHLNLLNTYHRTYDLAAAAIAAGKRLADLVNHDVSADTVDYDAVYAGRSDWKLLSPYDHPEPSRLYVTGTGLTHRASADNRQSMHTATGPVSDSMKMYQSGLEGGRPQPGCIGASPEWFYKGTGRDVRAPGHPLTVPWHGDDGGDEAEIAGVYQVGPDAVPYRVGLVQSNEFSDHVLEARNYLYLASSKLRACSIGPELVVDADFADVPGQIRILRGDKVLWQAPLASGEKYMCHSLANLEHHHFKHAAHRHPGDAHLHFFGADMFSFKDRLRLEDGDVMELQFTHFGRPLQNPLKIDRTPAAPVVVRSL